MGQSDSGTETITFTSSTSSKRLVLETRSSVEPIQEFFLEGKRINAWLRI